MTLTNREKLYIHKLHFCIVFSFLSKQKKNLPHPPCLILSTISMKYFLSFQQTSLLLDNITERRCTNWLNPNMICKKKWTKKYLKVIDWFARWPFVEKKKSCNYYYYHSELASYITFVAYFNPFQLCEFNIWLFWLKRVIDMIVAFWTSFWEA